MQVYIIKFTYLLIIIFLFGNIVFSQPISPWVSPSPTSYSFSRYGEIPISNYTGIPDILIQLATIRENDVETSVSISYHGAGIKVDETGSWVGLGWNLNAGGCISRTIRGKPEYPDPNTGELKPDRTDLGFPVPDNPDGTFDDLTLFETAYGPSKDIEPDIFICNFDGKFAKFVFDEDGNVRFFNHQDWDVRFLPSNPEHFYESKFIITTEDGTKYEFDERDMLWLGGYNTAPCAWYVTKIESPTGNTISFEYSSFNVQNYTHGVTSVKVLQNNMRYTGSADDYPVLEGFSNRSEVFLTKIVTNNSGWIDFKVDNSENNRRRDYNNSYNYPLDSIIVFDKNGTHVKCFKFYSSYFTSPAFSSSQFYPYLQYPYTALEHLRYRLRLDSLKEFSGDRQSWIPPYKFVYNSQNLPYRLSPDQDYWGYFNDAGNTTLLPTINNWGEEPGFWMDQLFNPTSDINYNFSGISDGAVKEPDTVRMKACILEKIYYPTGGSTGFTFEANDYSDNFYNRHICGGLRIKSIKNFNESDVKVREKEYIYKDFIPAYKEITTHSSGRLVEHPKVYYLTIGKVEDFSNFVPSEGSDLATDLGNPTSGNCYYYDGVADGYYNIIFYISALPVLSLGNAYINPMGYQSVIAKEQGNGYSVYFYTGPGTYPNYSYPEDLDYSLTNLNLFKTQYSTTIPGGDWGYLMLQEEIKSSEWPYLYPYENDWQRGLLTNVYHYSNSNTLIRSQVNDYYIENHYNTPGYLLKKLRTASTEFIHGKYLIPSGWTALKRQTDYQYNASGNIADIQEFRYEGNGHKMLTTLKTYNSMGDSILRIMSYPKDHPSGINTPAPTLDSLISHNIIYPVLKEEVKLNGTTFLSGTVNNYKIENNLILSSDIRVAKTDGTYETKEKFNRFDSRGNLIEYYKMTDNDSISVKTSYSLGYNNTFPVIKAENVDYTTLTAEISNSLPSGFASLDALLTSITSFPNSNWNTFNNNLRSRQSLSNAFITTYTYKSQVGMTSITDPNGVTISYEYDDFGRLICIKDDDGRILKTFEYHYKQ